MSDRTKTYLGADGKTYYDDNISEEAHKAIEVSLEAQLAKQGVKTALSAALSWIPIINAIPFGDCIKIVGYKGAEKLTQTQNKAEGLEGKTLSDYKHTKAFLLYLGLPPMNDPLYARWVSVLILFF